MHFDNFRFWFWIFLASWGNFGFGLQKLVNAVTAVDVFCEHFSTDSLLNNWFSYC